MMMSVIIFLLVAIMLVMALAVGFIGAVITGAYPKEKK